VVNETLTIKLNLIFKLNTAFLEVSQQQQQQQHPTVEDAVENFHRNLIQKERDIGGIINARTVTNRFFKLQYSRSVINVRCSYHSDFKNKTLRIYCHQFTAPGNSNQRQLLEKSYIFERDFKNYDESKTTPQNAQSQRNIGTYHINDYNQVLHISILLIREQ